MGLRQGRVRTCGSILLLIVLTLSAFASAATPVHAAGIAYVQSAATSSSASGASITAAFPAANTAGNLIVATVSFDSANGLTWSCSDTQGNTYSQAAFLNDTRHNQTLGICYASNVKAGANTVSVGFGGVSQAWRDITVQEYSGVAAVTPLDKTAIRTMTSTTAANNVTSGAVIPVVSGELIFGTTIDDSGTATITAGTSYTRRQFVATAFASEDQVQATAGSVAATFTSSAARDYIAAVATFKPAGSVPADIIAPTVSLTAPLANALASGTAFAVSATASDNVAVAGVQFLLDGANLGAEDVASPYSIAWNTTTATNGVHTLTARARDGAGNTATSTSVTVTVDNQAPTVPTGVTATAVSGSQINISWNASTDTSGVTGYKVLRTTQVVGTPLGTSFSDTGLQAGTFYSYLVEAVDAAGNVSGPSSAATATTFFNSDTTAPSVSIASPQNGAVVSGITAITANVSDPTVTGQTTSGIAGVQFLVDSAKLGAEITTAPYTLNWDTTQAADGTHGLSVTVRDAAGNRATSTSVSVTSNNTTIDTVAPTVPLGLVATAISSAQVNLSWTPSTDNVFVSGYQIQRNGVQIATSSSATYSDATTAASTAYSYQVSAFDAAGNVSAFSAVASVTTPAAAHGAAFPLKKSANGRYYVDQNNVPFMLVGDSPQSLLVNLSESQADAFFADREAQGFNALWLDLLVDTYTGGRTDGSTFDGILPFTTPGDLSTPNPVYFSRMDRIIADAAQHGILIFLDPIETGGWSSVIANNGAAKDRAYGQWLANRYKGYTNIVWAHGNDFCGNTDPTSDANTVAVALGVKDIIPNAQQTVEFCYNSPSASLDDPLWNSVNTTDGAYTYTPYYAEILHEYNRSNFLPIYRAESRYENEGAGAYGLRRQEYETMLSGAYGQFYGNSYTVGFLAGWQNNLDTVGTLQLGNYMKNFFASRDWYDLVPDQNHTFVTAGYGTFSNVGDPNNNDYVTSARTPDGKLGLAYAFTGHPITVDMSKLSGPVNARWYDPSANTYSTVAGSPFANTGSKVFTTPGFTSDNFDDFVLVLEAQGADVTPPTVPTNLAATSVTSSQVNLAWTASSDNIGIAGYKISRNGLQVGTSVNTFFTDVGLSPVTTYSYAVSAFDASGNVSALSTSISTTTPPLPPPDTIAPTVTLTAPIAGATVSGTISVSANASDNVAVVGVQFAIDGAAIGAEVANAPYSVLWGTVGVANGAHTLTAVARDAAGNTATSSVSVTVSNAPNTGLVAAYSFNEGTGLSAADASGNNNVGTLSSVTWATGKNGSAASFNGSNSRVTVVDASSLHLTSAMTLEAWVNPTTPGNDWHDVVYKGNDNYFLMAGTTNASRPAGGGTFGGGPSTTQTYGTAALATNAWAHIAVTYDGATIRLYVNGVQVSSVARAGSITTSANPLTIGSDPIYGQYFAGLVDDVRVYNRALSAAEVTSDMNTPVN